MLNQVQLDEFERLGLVRVQGAFSLPESKAMQDALWNALHGKHGVSPDDRTSWHLPAGLGLQKLRAHETFKPIFGPALRSALDDLIGRGCWQQPPHWGSFLVSFPAAPGAKSRPNFHTDFPYDIAADRVDGALVFAFLGAVPESAGGTLVVEGSHRVVARFIQAKPHLRSAKMKVTRKALLASHPFLTRLCGDWTAGDWVSALPKRSEVVLDNAVRVIELTGQPGDVVICHPWMLHSPSPNRGTGPRLMTVQRIHTSTSRL